jgi:hypothetical protein
VVSATFTFYPTYETVVRANRELRRVGTYHVTTGVKRLATRVRRWGHVMHKLRHLTAQLATAAALCLLLGCNTIFAADTGKRASAAAAADSTDTGKKASTAAADAADSNWWGGLGLGIGISVSADVGRQSHIVDAAVVNGLVRIKDTQDVIVGFVLEAHYFFHQGRYGGFNPTYWDPTWGTGPFVAIEIGGAVPQFPTTDRLPHMPSGGWSGSDSPQHMLTTCPSITTDSVGISELVCVSIRRPGS